MKKIVLLILFAALMLPLPLLFRKSTEGFRLGKLACDVPFHFSSNHEIPEVLQHSFTFFSRGAQTFVFLSEDGRYILKLFRNDPWVHPWRKFLRDCFFRKSRMAPEKKIYNLLNAAKIASEKAPDLTGICYAHLSPTTHLPKTLLIAPFARRFSVDLNRYSFVIQHRAEPIAEVFRRTLDRAAFRRISLSFIELLKERTARKIYNSDKKIAHNFGFLGDRAIEWDFGNYSVGEMTEAERLVEIDSFAPKIQLFLSADRAAEYRQMLVKAL